MRAALGFFIFGIVAGTAGCGSSTMPNIQMPNTQMFYRFSGIGSGSLGSTSFSNAPFTLVVTADTRALTSSTPPCSTPGGVCQVVSVPATSIQFSLNNQIVSANLTSNAGLFVNQTFPTVGIQRLGSQGNSISDAMDIQDRAFSAYDLKSAFGPVTSSSVVLQFSCSFGCIATSMGNLTIDTVSSATFSASSTQ